MRASHGMAAADSSTVMRFLADHRIRPNICPTSNLMLGRVEKIEKHSGEFHALYSAGLFSAKELDQIRLNSLNDV
jgi:adenosine deaminase